MSPFYFLGWHDCLHKMGISGLVGRVEKETNQSEWQTGFWHELVVWGFFGDNL